MRSNPPLLQLRILRLGLLQYGDVGVGVFPERTDLFLAQKIEVGVTAGTRIDDGGKVTREVVGEALVVLVKRKGELERDLGFADQLAVPPGLTIKGRLAW